MKTNHYITLMLLMLFGALTSHAQTNTLTIPDVTVAAGKTISLPINLDNTADVVAVQFTLTIPEGIIINPASASLTTRNDGHQVVMQPVGPSKFMTMIFSDTNKSIKGRTGKLVSVPLTASSSLEEGTELQLELSDVVIGAVNGDNLATGYSAGKVIIAKSPDLEVSSVNTSASTLSPGEKLNVSWQVSNIGDMPTEIGWNEQIYLDSEDGTSKLIGTTYYEGALNPSGVVSRSVEIELPQILGLDGNSTIRVKLTPDSHSGEPSWLRDNNTAISASSINVKKMLTLTPTEANVDEAEGQSIRFYLQRSGSTKADEIFSFGPLEDTRIILPETLTIPKGQSGVYFFAKIQVNGVLDDSDLVSLTLSADGYQEVGATIKLEDDTYPSLTLTSSTNKVEEGQTVTFTITAQRAPKEDLEIKLSSDLSSRFEIPTVVLPAGQTSVDVKVEAIEDDVPDIDQVVTFTASAARYNSDSKDIELLDNDMPTLELTLTPDAVSEAAGPLAVVATLRRTNNIDKSITIKFFDDSEQDIYYGNPSVPMPSGVEEVIVSLGPVDNAIVDGERTYNISAAVWIPSCGCNAQSGMSGGVVTVPLTVYDNDGPALSLNSSSSSVKEGGEITVTVSRNTQTTNALTVKIRSDHDSALEYPASVTIAEGETSASFVVKSIKNDVNDDSFTAIMTVESEGYAKANIWFMVTDQTLPDAQITAFEVSETEIEVGTEITLTTTVANTGSYVLPELTQIGFYHKGSSSPLATSYLQAPLAPGENVEIVKTISVPDAVGTYDVYAVANDGKQVTELLYTNNTSATVAIKAVSPFAFNLNTNKEIYLPGEAIEITGTVKGKDVANKAIELYLINEGYRHVINLETDSNGGFKTVYEPFAGQMGQFSVGACYPNEGKMESMSSFNVYGIKRTSNSYITFEPLMGEDHSGSFTIRNPGSLPLTGVKVSVASKPENCVVEVGCPQTLDAASNAEVTFKVTANAVSEGNDWERVVLNIETNEGASLQTTLYYYCLPLLGELKADVSSIDCTVTKGNTREYAVTVTNIGKGETGLISLSINTPWIKSLTPIQMSSLQHGESATILLEFDPKGYQLNVPQNAMIGINCQSGKGLPLSVRMEPVSEETGMLEIDVCDQFTYNTDEAPHVSGAEVSITHPVTGAVIVKGNTNEQGLFETELPEGYYGIYVTASEHDSYHNNILVNPGRKTNKTVNLGYNGGISISYVVQPVEGGIEDVYEIVTVVKYETNVPVPVVVLEGPTSIDAESMRPGESVVLNYVATNKGLVTALDFYIVLPEANEDFSMTALYDEAPIDVAPNQSIQFPILFTRNPYYNNPPNASEVKRSPGTDLINNFNTCMAGMEYWYKEKCGTDLRNNRGALMLALKACAYGSIAGTVMGIISNAFPSLGGPSGGGGGWGGGYSGGGSGTFVGIDPDKTICNPAVAAAGNDAINGALGMGLGPIASAFDTGINAAAETAVDGHPSADTLIGAAIGAVTPFTPEGVQMAIGAGQGINSAAQYIANHGDVWNTKAKTINAPKVNKAKGILPSWMVYFGQVAEKFSEQIFALVDLQEAIFGDRRWIESYDEAKVRLLEEMLNLSPSEFTVENLKDYKPESVSTEMFNSLIERIYNVANQIDSDNLPDYATIISSAEKIQEFNDYAIENGYSSMLEMFEVERDKYFKLYNEESNSVCSSVSLQFNQKMVMTREAFRGTLTVYNGHDSDAMEDIVLNLTVVDNKGKAVTDHEMTIATESVNNFGGSSSADGWTLESKETGVATILYIPTKYAAPTEPINYTFGGSLTYTNPYNGLRVTEQFSPVTLTVHPSPNLDLTYFMQRDIIGDDPLTEEIEPSIEAEFSLLINNIGYGDATNVRMMTNQPRIVDNEKGLKIDFELMSSQLNGGDKNPALGGSVATDFGTIPAKSTSYAQWWIKSSLLGHFTEYDVKATHVTSYDNPDLSLLNEVTIHELIRSLEITDGENSMIGFLTNDIIDSEDLPDMLYLSNGEIESVSMASSLSISSNSETDYTLSVNPSKEGWNYGSVNDPTYGVVNLKKVVRQSDGKEISLRNFWQTDRTLRDGKEPLYENRIHIADNFASGNVETYILTFEPMPGLLLEVASIEGLPTEGTIATSHVDKVNVMFNKYIDPETFTTDDITLAVQGKNQDSNLIIITTVDNKTFTLDMSEVNKNCGNGYYVLTIQTAEITDVEGFNGRAGKTVGWNMYQEGLVSIKTLVNPEQAGNVTISGETLYGQTITLTATANEGYEFQNWTLNGTEVSKNAEFDQVVLTDMTLQANFTKKNYSITIDNETEGGTITGAYTGIYPYGQQLSLSVETNDGYLFRGWMVNQELVSEETTLSITVDSEMSVSAVFEKDSKYEQVVELFKGWNWVSSYLNSALPIQSIMDGVNRIVGQFDESIMDPELGFVGSIDSLQPGRGYKIETSADCSMAFTDDLYKLEESPITVNRGWNWIAYPYHSNTNIGSVITNAEEGDYIASQFGFTEYSEGNWEGSIAQFHPGEGYLYKSSSEKTLGFNFENLSNKSNKVVSALTNTYDFTLTSKVDAHKYPNTMNIVGRLYINGEEVADEEDQYDIYAFSGNELRGVGRMVNGTYYITVYGEGPAEISFIIEDGGQTYLANETMVFTSDIVGSRKEPYSFTVGEPTGINTISSAQCDIVIYSIEGILINRKATMDDIKRLERGIYIINGKKYLVK